MYSLLAVHNLSGTVIIREMTSDETERRPVLFSCSRGPNAHVNIVTQVR